MASGSMGTHGQSGVEQKDTLLCPASKIAGWRNGRTQVCLNLRKDIAKRWRKRYSVIHGEAKSMCLTRLMVGVLPDEHDFHAVQWAEIKSIKDELAWRIACAIGILRLDKLDKLLEIRLVDLRL